MSRTRTSVGIGLSALASFGVAAYMSGRRAVPSWSGTVTLPTLDGPAEVLRDTWAVPAAFASSELDAYRIQGWLHATDRTFQLDLMRRVGLGRLAELVGEPGLASDRLMHTLDCPRMVDEEWELLEADHRATLEAYAEGVNAGFARARRRLPVEFRLLGAKPDPWRPQDSLALSRVLALGLSGNWESELARGEIQAAVGTDVLDALEAGEHERAWPAQIHREVLGELIAATRDAASTFGGPGGVGSNNWVIGPRRTRSGGAILANDPHLDLQMPSVWYEQRLSGGDLDVRGFTFPGVPGVVLGHNGRIAWGFTNSSIDVQDCYLEELDDAGDRYRDVGGEWRDLERRDATIKVKGGADVRIQVRSTRRGPIITDVATSSELSHPVSLRWDSLRPGTSARTVHMLNRADDWDDFREACSHWLAPAQNVVFADASGNIGFQHMGEVPIRAEGNDGSVPRRGDDPQGEWVGTIPWEEQPHAFNPTAGRIVTANDRLVGDDYPYFMSREWMNGYRGERIRDLIDGVEGHAVGDQVRIQTDVYSLPGVRMRDLLERLRPEPATANGAEVLRQLLAWDGELRANDDASAAWRLLLRATQDEAFGFLGELLPRFLGYSRSGVNGFWSLFSRSTPLLLDGIDKDDRQLLEAGASVARRHAAGEAGVPAPLDGWTPHGSWRALLAAALDRAGAWWAGEGPDEERATARSMQRTTPGRALRTAGGLGERMEERLTRRRRLHRLRLQHPLGVVPGLARVANRGPYPMPGDADTVWQTSQFNNPMNEYALVGPSHRHVVDLSDVDRSVAVLCGGQSGHPASPHYADQVGMWRRGEVRPAPFTRPAIERNVRYRQKFTS
ncbi:MAG: peptidase penicillin amidase [Thermoleophilia bacterium]|nr:peptidase penicillin amidase [Thermoleophilia bacterium]